MEKKVHHTTRTLNTPPPPPPPPSLHPSLPPSLPPSHTHTPVRDSRDAPLESEAELLSRRMFENQVRGGQQAMSRVAGKVVLNSACVNIQ